MFNKPVSQLIEDDIQSLIDDAGNFDKNQLRGFRNVS